MKKLSIGDFRVRVRIKANNPTSDGAGGLIDAIEGHDLQVAVYEVWAHVEVGGVSRHDEGNRTNQERRYTITTRATFGYTPIRMPLKNMLVEIVGFTTTDAMIQGVAWDDWNNYWVIKAVEKL